MKTTAIIPARGGSKRVPNKNIKNFAGLPLIIWTISEVIKSETINDYCVSTDSDIIINLLKKYKVNFIKRSKENSQDTSTTEDLLLEFKKNYKNQTDILAYIQCTNPFDGHEVYDSVVKKLINNIETHSSCFASSKFKGWLWKDENNSIGINHNKEIRERSQDINWDSFIERGSIVALKLQEFNASNNRFLGKTCMFEVTNKPFIDIDSPLDFEIAEAIFSKRRSYERNTENIKIIFSDFDGVFTDNKVLTNQNGEESVIASKYDSMILKSFPKSIKFIVISSEKNDSVAMRCKKLGLEYMYGIENKIELIKSILIKNSISWKESIYIGNDYNDILPMITCGYSLCPQDSPEKIKFIADEVLCSKGGDGVIRELFEKYFNESY